MRAAEVAIDRDGTSDMYCGPQAVTHSGNRLAACLLPGGGYSWWILGFSQTWNFDQITTLVGVATSGILMDLGEAVSRGVAIVN